MRSRLVALIAVALLAAVGVAEQAALAAGGPVGSEDVSAQVGGSPGAGGSTGVSGAGWVKPFKPGDSWCLQFSQVGAEAWCYNPPPGEPAVEPTPELLAIAARETLEYVMPEPMTSPPKGGFQLVAIKTWMYMDEADWHPVSATATAGAVSATVTATPTTITWDMGEGDPPVVCDGPGEPWQRGHEAPCGYIYDYHGEYTITVTVAWRLKWVASNGTVGLFADRELTTTFPLNVQEAQAVTD